MDNYRLSEIKDMWINNLNNIDFLKKCDKIKILQLLYDNNLIDTNSIKLFTPLIDMIKNGFNIYDIKQFLDKGISIDEINDDGYFPLYSALEQNNIKLIDLLLEYKADINQQYYNKYNTRDINNGKTILHVASEHIDIPICKFLLYKNADPNILDINGNNAIQYVLKNNNYGINIYKEQLIGILIKYKCNPHLNNNNNESSIDYGLKKNINILDIEYNVKLENAKKRLNIFKGIHYRLGENSVLKNLPFDLIDKMYNN